MRGQLATRTLTNLLGQSVTVCIDDRVARKLERDGLYERDNLLFLLGILKRLPAPVVLDVGANVGNHALAFATVAKQVLAFEPHPFTFSLLQRNIRDNALRNVRAFNLALSDQSGEARLFTGPEGMPGASSLDQRTEAGDALPILCSRGDELLNEVQVEKKIDLIKLDVEAHEYFALSGLMATLRRHLPFITLEWNDRRTIERMTGSPLMHFLEEHYQFHVLGSRYDRGYWCGRPFAFLRRKLFRLFRPRDFVLCPFDPTQLYKNLLLVPKGREALLDG